MRVLQAILLLVILVGLSVVGSTKENLPLVFVEANSLNQIIAIKKEKSSSR